MYWYNTENVLEECTECVTPYTGEESQVTGDWLIGVVGGGAVGRLLLEEWQSTYSSDNNVL